MSGNADFYASGQFNFYCDLCGAKEKSSKGVKTWNNLYVCAWHKEVRNPQDFLKGVRENMSLPWTRPEAPDQFVPTTYGKYPQEYLDVSEKLAKTYTRYVNPPKARSTVLNGTNINYSSINGGEPQTYDAEVFYFTETFLVSKLYLINEQLVFAETTSAKTRKTFNDSMVLGEVARKNYSHPVPPHSGSEQGQLGAAIVNALAINSALTTFATQEKFTFNEFTNRTLNKSFKEMFALSEFVSPKNNEAFYDNFAINETFVKRLTRSINPAKSTFTLLNGSTLNFSAINTNDAQYFDNMAFSETVSIIRNQVLYETFSIVENVKISRSFPIYDNFAINETFVKRLTHSINPAKSTFTLLNGSMLNFSAININDAQYFDNLAFSETVVKIANRGIMDLLPISETLVLSLRNVRSVNSTPINSTSIG